MLRNEVKNYQLLNELAEQNGTIIFGGTNDMSIPLCELKQAFELDNNLYNRSIPDLSIYHAIEYYDACVAVLHPGSVLLHIGEADIDDFLSDAAGFDQKYRELIAHIRNNNDTCRIAIISLKNYNNDTNILEINKHLRYIAESEHCEFADIASIRMWNPKQTRDVSSFLYSTGFIRPLGIKRPIFDLVKILFCFEPSCI